MSEMRMGGFQPLPTVIKYLIIINIIVWLTQLALPGMYGIRLSDYLALRYWGSEHFRPHQFITHMFLHDDSGVRFGFQQGFKQGFLHIFSNMFALWMFGSILENRWGPKRFLNFYLICGLGAAVCQELVLTWENITIAQEAQLFFDQPTLENFRHIALKYKEESWYGFLDAWQKLPPDSDALVWQAKHEVSLLVDAFRNGSMVGASGAVFGVLLAFGYLYPNVEMFIIPIPFPIKAKFLIGGYILLELYVGFRNSGDGIAHFAHIGGALFGYILLKIWRERSRPRS
ncbi:rhomboid family intramembrane serine protease [Chitinophaga rhizosphaerae]|uniref:rhomboid family intramembrane serine protease n=1 Tax=Chitinophaga rhizosphaerae TaxID=1864947 RepID=UPI000F805A16|nr:rhomboid family intramembrane serine protease [Chitinophaga rhizosphaerae]